MSRTAELNNIHSKYGLTLDTQDKAKTILVGDKLKWAEEQMEIVQGKLKFSELDFIFRHYAEVRNEIGKLDDDIISIQDAYIKEISEAADKIAQENALLRLRRPGRPRPEPDIDLGEDGKPQLVTDTTDGEEAQEEPIEEATDFVPLEPVEGQGKRKSGIFQYSKDQRRTMLEKAYFNTAQGTRTTGEILRTWERLYKGVTVTKTFIALYCKKLGYPLQGKLKRKKVA